MRDQLSRYPLSLAGRLLGDLALGPERLKNIADPLSLSIAQGKGIMSAADKMDGIFQSKLKRGPRECSARRGRGFHQVRHGEEKPLKVFALRHRIHAISGKRELVSGRLLEMDNVQQQVMVAHSLPLLQCACVENLPGI